MPRGFILTDIQQKKVLNMYSRKFCQYEIARKINKSQTCVSHFLKDPKGYNKKKHIGRPKKLSARARMNRQINEYLLISVNR